MKSLWRDRPVVAWAFYDWANSAFALIVMTAFVPLMLGAVWNDGAPSTVTTFRLGIANGIASVIVVVLAPLLGAITDQARRRKPWLAALTAIGVLATGAMAALSTGDWRVGLGLYVLASVGFFGANSLYDAMLMDVAEPRRYDLVSAFGYALGYLGGALLFTVCVLMLARPEFFGLASMEQVVRLSFILVAAWWGFFALPLLFFVRERPAAGARPDSALSAGFRELGRTLARLPGQRNLLLFLVAYWLYIDGVYTIIKMAVDFGLSQGLSATDVTAAILITNFIGFPAALAFGGLGDRIGPKPAIYLALGVYVVATGAAVFLTTAAQFYGLAVAIGLVQGGVQSLSRSLFARLVAVDRRGEYFGFYNMLGKFASIIGPVLAGTMTLVAGSQRIGILSILVLFIAGFVLLTRVKVPDEAGTPVPVAETR